MSTEGGMGVRGWVHFVCIVFLSWGAINFYSGVILNTISIFVLIYLLYETITNYRWLS